MSDNKINPIKQWLSGNRSYKDGLALFLTYGVGVYPKIYAKVSQGNFGENRSYLEHYLIKLSKDDKLFVRETNPQRTKKKNEITISPPKETPLKKPVKQVDTRQDLLKKISSQKNKRLQLSQSFQNCETDLDREQVCIRIDRVNAIIQELSESLQYFEKFGALPEHKQDDLFLLGETDAELQIQQNRAQANKGGIKKKIEHALLFPEGSKERSKLKEWEEKHTNLLIRIQLIKDERQRIKNS